MERDMKKIIETLQAHEADNALLNDVLLMTLTNQIQSLKTTKNAVVSIEKNLIKQTTLNQNQIEIMKDFIVDLAERLIVLEKKL